MCRPLDPIEMPEMEKSEIEMVRLQNIEEFEAAFLQTFGTPIYLYIQSEILNVSVHCKKVVKKQTKKAKKIAKKKHFCPPDIEVDTIVISI